MKNKKKILIYICVLCFLTIGVAFFANFYRAYSLEKNADKVVLRFAVTSKTYVFDKSNGTIVNFFDKVYSYAENQEYTGVDAFVINGNVTGDGSDTAFLAVEELANEHLKKDSKLYTTMGEMDFVVGETDEVNDPGIQQKIQDITVNIKGYDFVFLSPVYSSYSSKLNWLDNTLSKLTADNDKPVFLFQYSALKNTYYGTKSWYNIESDQILNVIEKYDTVVDFSSSSSNSNNTPKSVFQKNATYVNTGVTTQIRMNYDEYGYDTSSEIINSDFSSVKQCQIVEVYGDGSIVIKPMDLNTGNIYTSRFDGTQISYDVVPGDIENYKYSTENNTSKTIPSFNENTVITAAFDEDDLTKVVISFDNAVDEDGILFYKVSIYDNNNTLIVEKNTYSDFPLYEGLDKKSCTIEGLADYDTFTVEVTPFDMYGISGVPISSVVSWAK